MQSGVIVARNSFRPIELIGWHTRAASVLLALALAILHLPTASAEGFGTNKKKITLHRKLPPAVHLTGSAIYVQGAGHDAFTNDVAQQLATVLETELERNDKRLRTETQRPEVTITCQVTHFTTPLPQQVQHAVVYGKTLKPETFKKITGEIAVSYQAKDTRTSRLLDSNNVTANYDEEFESSGEKAGKSFTEKMASPFKRLAGKKVDDETAPTDVQLRQILIVKAVNQIASRLVQTDETIDVYLARGKELDAADKFADSGLWSRMLDSLEQMEPLPKKEDDAFRLYNIGVANEALAYQTEDSKAANKYVQAAMIHYGKALDLNPGEKMFVEPQRRIETAMAHFKALNEPGVAVSAEAKTPPAVTPANSAPAKSPASGVKKTPSATQSAVTAKTAPGNGANSTAGAGKSSPAAVQPKIDEPPLTNESVIQLVKAGMDEENLVVTIRQAHRIEFDLSQPGLLHLVQSGVKGKVLIAMRERAAHNPQTIGYTTTSKHSS
jgi:hypothetical protein